ncbi:MAG: hypothetical protein ACHQK8_06420 [Bacteroidia bacterium]
MQAALSKHYFSPDKIFHYLFFISGITFIGLAVFTEGNGEGGDSFMHYFFARYSWIYPEFFLNHWAKPVFTLFASPFAQFGFTGIKLFNVFVALASCYLAFLTAKKLEIKYAFLVPLLYLFTRTNVVVTLSGLTEPLFALLLIGSVYLLVCNKSSAGILIASFLPFVRSEGLVILCVLFVYLVFTRKIKFIPLLLTGHAVFALAGGFYYNDLLWVFNRIPYAAMNDHYGHGTWDHFIIHLIFIIGPVLYALLIFSGIMQLAGMKKVFKNEVALKKIVLLFGIFVAFLFAHSAFWALGIFNSMGMARVFVGVFPVIFLISLDGLDKLTALFSNAMIKTVLVLVFVFSFIIVTFSDHPSSFRKSDMMVTGSQEMIRSQLIPYLKAKFPGHKIYTSNIDVNFFLGTNVFDVREYGELKELKPDFRIKKNEVVVWDNWCSVIEEGVSKEALLHSNQIKMDTTFSGIGYDGSDFQFVTFTTKNK